MVDNLLQSVFIVGLTGGGKSTLGMKLAERFSGEILNADSLQFYDGFIIGSASPSKADRLRIPHHLFNVIPPDQHYSAGEFSCDAGKIIRQVCNRGNLPFVVGGTGLYVESLIHGLAPIRQFSDEQEKEWRDYLEDLESNCNSKDEFVSTLWHELRNSDPLASSQLAEKDVVRISRALKVFKLSGRSIIEYQRKQSWENRYSSLIFCLLPDREYLCSNIRARVDEMLIEGLVSEVKNLLKQWGRKVKPMRGIGYAEVIECLDGKITPSEMKEKIIITTRQLAKRQRTWWRNQPIKRGWEVKSVNLSKAEDPLNVISEIISKWKSVQSLNKEVKFFRLKVFAEGSVEKHSRTMFAS